MRSFNIITIALVLFFVSCATGEVRESKKGVTAKQGMVVTAHPEASRIGLEILQKGGTAIDAAIAVEFALAVSYPTAGNIGGGGYMVVRFNDGTTDALDFREKAPEEEGMENPPPMNNMSPEQKKQMEKAFMEAIKSQQGASSGE